MPSDLLRDGLAGRWASPLAIKARRLAQEGVALGEAAERLRRMAGSQKDLKDAWHEADAWWGLARGPGGKAAARLWRQAGAALGSAMSSAHRRSLPPPTKADFESLLARVQAEARRSGQLAEVVENDRSRDEQRSSGAAEMAWWWSDRVGLAAAAIGAFLQSWPKRKEDGSWSMRPVSVSGFTEYTGHTTWHPSAFSFDSEHLADIGSAVRSVGIGAGLPGRSLSPGEEAACLTVASWFDGLAGAGPYG